MTLILVALGGFLIGVGVTVSVARYFFLLGWEKGRDDQVLDPGETVGELPAPVETPGAAGESSGRHALPDLPDDMDTEQFDAVAP